MSTRDFSSEQEKKLAEDLNGKLTPNSGGLSTSASWKCDLYTEEEKIEAKITKKDYYVLKFADLEKLKGYAAKHRGREPVFIFEFYKSEKYVVTFCSEFPECEVLIKHGKSIKLYRDVLYDMTVRGEILGIEYDYGVEIPRKITIKSYTDWRS